MAKITGFKEFKRQNFKRREVKDRVKDWKEIYFPWTEKQAGQQASRCMDCGVPFCNNGCPLGNLIPDWNDLVRIKTKCIQKFSLLDQVLQV